MPTIEIGELGRMVADGEIGAITIDTSIFDRFSCDLDAASLVALEQFAGSRVQYLLTDVVLGEVRTHMIRDAERVTAEVESALKELGRYRRRPKAALGEVAAGLGLETEISAEVDARIADYVAATEATMLTAGSFLDAGALLADYFATSAPFQTGKGKRAEFPDAIALLQLERWGELNGKHVLAIAADGGWASFADRAKWVIVLGDLVTALGLFNRVDQHTIERATALLADEGRSAFLELSSALESYIDGINPDVQAQSYLFFDADLCSVSLKAWQAPAAEDMTVIASDDRSITLSFRVSIVVEAEADFTFSVRDSWDGDHVSVGGTSAARDIPVEVPVVMRVAREGGPDEAVLETTVEGERTVTLDFGSIEPNEDDS